MYQQFKYFLVHLLTVHVTIRGGIVTVTEIAILIEGATATVP